MEIANLLNRPTLIEFVDTGYSQSIEIEFLKNLLPRVDPLFDPDYWRNVVQHYVPLLVADISEAIAKD
jgi:hypothetical protein